MATEDNIDNNWRIGHATSPDGIVWQRENGGDPVLNIGAPGEWDDHRVGHPTVLREGFEYKMWFYGARGTGVQGSIGSATSPDGITWTKYDDPSTTNPPYAQSDPVLTGDMGNWDQFIQQQPSVILDSAVYHMWYAAQGPGITGQSVGYAHSTDGIEWDKPLSDPVLRGTFQGFDHPTIIAPSVVLIDTIFHMWYTGAGNAWRIGYASTDKTVDVEEENISIIKSFSLEQNYPNPFNPSTVIGYQLPVSGSVTLKIYDLLGREVATLVDEYKPAGRYEIEFSTDGHSGEVLDLTSGIYFYKLQAGEFVQTKKMILLR